MNRYPTKDVIKTLRNESGFQCSIPDCEIPYLEYHHFDPPWHVENHHDPEGMIALCPIHHRQADVKTWTNDQLKEFKKNNQNINSLNIVAGKFNYLRNNILMYAGGNYYYNNLKAEICLGKYPLIWFEKDENDMKLLNIILFDKTGKIFFHLENNSWKIKDGVKDIDCPPNGRSLRVDFINGNYVKIEFKELESINDLSKNISQNYISSFEQKLPITLLKVNLKLIEFNINFQANKMLLGNSIMTDCLFSENNVGIQYGT